MAGICPGFLASTASAACSPLLLRWTQCDLAAFIYVLAIMLDELVLRTTVQQHRESIFEVMGELLELIAEVDAPPEMFPPPRRGYVWLASVLFRKAGLQDE